MELCRTQVKELKVNAFKCVNFESFVNFELVQQKLAQFLLLQFACALKAFLAHNKRKARSRAQIFNLN